MLYIHADSMWWHKQHEAPPAEIISIVEQCPEAGAKTPTFSSPIPDEPPYHTQMFPIKGTHKPLHPEYVNHDKDPFKQRDSANCTLLLSFSVCYNPHFKSGSRIFFFFLWGVAYAPAPWAKHVGRTSVIGICKLTRKRDNTRAAGKKANDWITVIKAVIRSASTCMRDDIAP